jgi:hypothetical protein
MIFRTLLAMYLVVYALQSQAQVETQIPGVIERYAFLGDGSEVSDKKTKLIWKRCAEGETWTGGACQGNAQSYSWAEAMSKFGGENRKQSGNWHLPDIDQLASLRDCSREKTMDVNGTKVLYWCEGVHSIVFRNSLRFWSSTLHKSNSGRAMAIRFDASIITDSYLSSTYLVRLVRK